MSTYRTSISRPNARRRTPPATASTCPAPQPLPPSSPVDRHRQHRRRRQLRLQEPLSWRSGELDSWKPTRGVIIKKTGDITDNSGGLIGSSSRKQRLFVGSLRAPEVSHAAASGCLILIFLASQSIMNSLVEDQAGGVVRDVGKDFHALLDICSPNATPADFPSLHRARILESNTQDCTFYGTVKTIGSSWPVVRRRTNSAGLYSQASVTSRCASG